MLLKFGSRYFTDKPTRSRVRQFYESRQVRSVWWEARNVQIWSWPSERETELVDLFRVQ